jgi:pimeloyl-ACP methyl ester carboxylesterase
MRPLETALVAIVLIWLAYRAPRPRPRAGGETYTGFFLVAVILHVVFDGLRWEMIPAYLLGVWGLVLAWRDFRRPHGEPVPTTGGRPWMIALVAIGGLVAVLLPAWLVPRVTFDRPGGDYPVGRVEAFWVDSSRDEVLTPEPGDKRAVVLSIWYPADTSKAKVAPYHPDAGALEHDLMAQASMPGFLARSLTRAKVHALSNAPFNRREGRSPVLLFSHGFGLYRTQNTNEFEELASWGYVVVSIEHPYSAAGTVFPGGRHVPNTTARVVSSDTGAARLLGVWVDDARFVLTRLSQLPVRDATDTLSQRLRLDKVGYFGHSFGGAAAAQAMVRDERIRAGIDMDGMPYGDSWRKGVDRPFLVFRAHPPDFEKIPEEQLKLMNISRDSVGLLYRTFNTRVDSLLRFGGNEIQMDGIFHTTFTDVARWSPPLSKRLQFRYTDDPEDAQRAVTSYTLAFFNKYLKETKDEDNSVEVPQGVQVKAVPHKAVATAPAEPRRSR